MALKNIKNHGCGSVTRNLGILDVDQIQLEGKSSAPTDGDLANGRLYYNTAGALYGRIGGAWVSLGAGAGAGVTSWDEIYDLDQTLNVDTSTLTLNGTVTLGAGAVLTIANAGTGKDIAGPFWSIISTGSKGILELTSGGTINATGGAMTLGRTGTATTMAGTATIAGGLTVTAGGATVTAGGITVTAGGETITAGGLTISAGNNTMINTSNAAPTLMITNDTISTYGAGAASAGMVVLRSTTLTTGSLLRLQTTEATLTTGNYLDCYDVTGSAIVFEVGEDGAITIAGAAATNMLTITAGDVALSAGNLVLTAGNITVGGKTFLTKDTRTGAGAISVTTTLTEVVTTAADALTLADGATGQLKIISMITDGGDGTLTPAHPLGYATIAFTAVGNAITLVFLNAGWQIVANYGCTIA